MLYAYRCGSCRNHFERIARLGSDSAACPACGNAADRVFAPGTAFVVDPAPVPRDQQRYDLRLFHEASAEREYYHQRAEESAQTPLKPHGLWQKAKRTAGRIREGKAAPLTQSS